MVFSMRPVFRQPSEKSLHFHGRHFGEGQTGGNPGSKPFANGFAALASLDSNLDGKFDSADTLFTTLRVWVDANSDGKTDAGELKTFTELGITQINLTSTTQSGLVRDGNEVLARGTFVQSGLTKEALAANFLANPNGHTFTAIGLHSCGWRRLKTNAFALNQAA